MEDIMLGNKFSVEDVVYIPSSKLPDSNRYSTSIYRTTVVEVNRTGRSIKVRLLGGECSDWLGSSVAHKNLGIAIITIGDFATEETLLSPLAKSILQFSRLLLDDSSIVSVKVRSIDELKLWWEANEAAYTYIVFVGHGSPSDIYFACGGAKNANDFSQLLLSGSQAKKTFISLCCETGQAPFAEEFSKIPVCYRLIAPSKPVHGAIASHFFQTYMCFRLLEGFQSKNAFNRTNKISLNTFCLWEKGNQIR